MTTTDLPLLVLGRGVDSDSERGVDCPGDLPAPSDGGLTYRFQLRPGLRYSTGAPVRARDVRASIERAGFTLGTYASLLATT